MWYPNLVLTGGSVYVGLSGVLGSNLKAASWNGPTIDPLVIHPRSPCMCIRTWVRDRERTLLIIIPFYLVRSIVDSFTYLYDSDQVIKQVYPLLFNRESGR